MLQGTVAPEALDAQPTGQQPSASEASTYMTTLESRIASLKEQEAAATGRERREILAQVKALDEMRTELQLAPVKNAPEQESEPSSETPEAHDFSRDGGYSLELPSYVPQSAVTEQTGQMIEEYGVLARELNIAPDAAQQLLETYADASLALPEGLISGANQNETTSILRNIWGTEYDHNLKIVQETARSLGQKFCAWLDRDLGDGRMLSNDAAICQALLAHGKGWTRLSPAQAQSRLDKVMSDQRHPYWRGDKNSIAEVKALRQRVSGTAGKASATRPAVKPPAEPSGRQKVEQRIAAIRRHPHYVGGDKAQRSVLIAEMQQLQQQLMAMEGR